MYGGLAKSEIRESTRLLLGLVKPIIRKIPEGDLRIGNNKTKLIYKPRGITEEWPIIRVYWSVKSYSYVDKYLVRFVFLMDDTGNNIKDKIRIWVLVGEDDSRVPADNDKENFVVDVSNPYYVDKAVDYINKEEKRRKDWIRHRRFMQAEYGANTGGIIKLPELSLRILGTPWTPA